jgi:hypothetical protein
MPTLDDWYLFTVFFRMVSSIGDWLSQLLQEWTHEVYDREHSSGQRIIRCRFDTKLWREVHSQCGASAMDLAGNFHALLYGRDCIAGCARRTQLLQEQ